MADTEIWMCYGCCCGVEAKDSTWEPPKQPIEDIRSELIQTLEKSGQENIEVKKVGCLGPCSNGNMVVVHRKGSDGNVFEKINTPQKGIEIAEYAAALEVDGDGAKISDALNDNLFGSVNKKHTVNPPSPEPYADRH